MAITINGDGTITGLANGGLPDGCILDADINGMAASKLTGALPAISGASLTGVDAITMYDVLTYTSDVQGAQTPLSSHWARNPNVFDHTGSGMSQSSGIFTFPTTGKYHIFYKINYYSNGNNSQYAGAYLQVTEDNGSNWSNRDYAYGHFAGISGYNYDTAAGDMAIDVTDTTNRKVRLNAGVGNSSVYVMGNNAAATTHLTFIRLGDT